MCVCVLLITVCCLVIGDGSDGGGRMSRRRPQRTSRRMMFGAVKAGSGMWSSCLKIMHTTEGKTLELVQQNEAAFRCAVCTLI